MLLLSSLLLLQNIWRVTAPIQLARDIKCIFIYSIDQYPPPLAFDENYKIVPRYYQGSHETKLLLSCPGEGNYLKRTKTEGEDEKKGHDLEYHCVLGSWRSMAQDHTDNPHDWACARHPEGHFEKTGECSQRSSRFSFIINVKQKSLPMFNVCRTKENARTVSATHIVSNQHLPYLLPPEGATLPGRTFPIQAYSGFTGDPTQFKSYQQIAMEKEHGKEIAMMYVGNPESDLFLTPARVVPFEDFPQFEGLQAEHNSFLLYIPVLANLETIDEAMKLLSSETQMKIYVMTITSSDNEMFMKVKLFTPSAVVLLARQGKACLAFVFSNRLELGNKYHEYKCRHFCSVLGWPDLLNPRTGSVECCSPDEVELLHDINFDCGKDEVLQGPHPLPKPRRTYNL